MAFSPVTKQNNSRAENVRLKQERRKAVKLARTIRTLDRIRAKYI